MRTFQGYMLNRARHRGRDPRRNCRRYPGRDYPVMASPVPVLARGCSLMPEKIARSPVAIVLLAAGKASRMGGPHKLLATFDGISLVRIMAERACATGAPVFVVTGHRHPEITALLAGLPIENVHNPDFESGMASSIVAGFGAASASGSVGVLVMLADMPAVETSDLMALIGAFEGAGGKLSFARSRTESVATR